MREAPAGTRSSPAVLGVGALALLALYVAQGVSLGDRAATAAEARLASALVDLPYLLTWPEAAAAGQVRALGALVGVGPGTAVIGMAGWFALAVGLVTCGLLWPISRQLGAGPAAAGSAVALCGVAGTALSMHAAVSPGLLAALWWAVAVALSGLRPARAGGRLARNLAAGTAAAAGLITAPIAAVAALVLGAHLAAVGAIATGLRPLPRRLVVVAMAAAAGAVALLVTGGGAWSTPTEPPPPIGMLAAFGFVVVAVTALSWWRTHWQRPIGSAALALLGCALLPDAPTLTIHALLVPVLAVLAAGLIDQLGSARLAVVPTAVALVAAGAVAVPAGVSRPEPVPDVTTWVRHELAGGLVIAGDELTLAQLAADDVAVAGLVPLAPQSARPPADILMLVERPGSDQATHGLHAELAAGSVLLARLPVGPGGSPVEVRRPVVDATALAADRADCARFGAALAANPAVAANADVAQLLRSGDVDARLLVLLAAMTTVADRVDVDALPAAPGAAADAQRRQAIVTLSVEPDGSAVTEKVIRLLKDQEPPFAPMVEQLSAHQLNVTFPAPGRPGLLAG